MGKSQMRDLTVATANRYRVKSHLGYGDATCGTFMIPSPIDGYKLRVIASSGLGWDHVSVSRANRCPNWPEMDHVRKLLFRDDETVMQLHVPVTENLSLHDFCLHMWRPHNVEIPRPPAWMVAPTPNMEAEIKAAEAAATEPSL